MKKKIEVKDMKLPTSVSALQTLLEETQKRLAKAKVDEEKALEKANKKKLDDFLKSKDYKTLKNAVDKPLREKVQIVIDFELITTVEVGETDIWSNTAIDKIKTNVKTEGLKDYIIDHVRNSCDEINRAGVKTAALELIISNLGNDFAEDGISTITGELTTS